MSSRIRTAKKVEIPHAHHINPALDSQTSGQGLSTIYSPQTRHRFVTLSCRKIGVEHCMPMTRFYKRLRDVPRRLRSIYTNV